MSERETTELTGERLSRVLSALANPHRLRILAALTRERTYVSQLAREIGMSRPLLHMHLRRLEAAGLVSSNLELSEDGKALNFYEVVPFDLALNPETIARAASTLNGEGDDPDQNEPEDKP